MHCIVFDNDEIWVEGINNDLKFMFNNIPLNGMYEEIAPDNFVMESSASPSHNAFKINLRQIFESCGEDAFHLTGRARQLLHWRKTHQFCGCCGERLQRHQTETAMHCAQCGVMYYPRINPVVITLIHRDDSILLARRNDPNFNHFWSIVAGFVEAGESLVNAVRREIREEVGIEVKNITHVSSQQWPFPNNLMIGYRAEYASGEITPDGEEIAEARWFTYDNLPRIPGKVSIARKLIDAFFSQNR